MFGRRGKGLTAHLLLWESLYHQQGAQVGLSVSPAPVLLPGPIRIFRIGMVAL